MKAKRSDNFDKFANKKKGRAVKEEYRQEKNKQKKMLERLVKQRVKEKKILKEGLQLNL
jgi:23S rRNA pseudouridine2605 synthase